MLKTLAPEKRKGSRWTLGHHVNTTTTARPMAYEYGPRCDEGEGRPGYLYFDNGHLVAIQDQRPSTIVEIIRP
jgi:hypothetical protein